jgi:hypothetical protein
VSFGELLYAVLSRSIPMKQLLSMHSVQFFITITAARNAQLIVDLMDKQIHHSTTFAANGNSL